VVLKDTQHSDFFIKLHNNLLSIVILIMQKDGLQLLYIGTHTGYGTVTDSALCTLKIYWPVF